MDEIIGIARSPLENSASGELFGSFTRKVREGESIELLGRMGKG